MLLVFFSIFFGMLIGSFLNVLITRMPIMTNLECLAQVEDFMQSNAALEAKNYKSKFKHFNLMVPRSHCVNCNKQISCLENIPIFSFIFLKGKCRHCACTISLRYPLVETVTAVATVATIMLLQLDYYKTTVILIFVWTLITQSVIDIERLMIPDDLTLPVLWLGLIANCFNLVTSPQASIIGAATGYLFLFTVCYLHKLITNKDGIGHGDFKLLAMLGAWLGWQLLPLIIFVASLLGTIGGMILILSKKSNWRLTPIPFGPYLAAAGYLALIKGPAINSYYLKFLHLNF